MTQRRVFRFTLFYKCSKIEIIKKVKFHPCLHRKIKFRSDVHNINILTTMPAYNKELFKKSFWKNIMTDCPQKVQKIG